MRWFTATLASEAVVRAGRDEVWEVLTDPGLLARLTPLLERIEADGDSWRWDFARVPLLGISLSPSFTERMRFTDASRIDFAHDPPPGVRERTGVEGWYALADHDHGTHLAISLSLNAELPLSRAAGPAVRAAMRAVLSTVGAGFARNLLSHLGVPGESGASGASGAPGPSGA